MPGKQRIYGGLVGMSSCRTTFTSFADQTLFRISRLRTGSHFGKTISRQHGRTVGKFLFGNASIGTGSCGVANRILRNGITLKTIQSVMVMSLVPKTGLTKENSTCLSGTI